ncbi:uncharacterized protein LOC128891506 [Hylaeus anthracinus]|uniref:uncharacterized protein LOC128891506 n=1 Tax=Hylaeus anthracinus TaxID=313031 RepID=UPI0023B9CD1F|nr:uncharacterized protein LOC128891506 [Hylaeus anthracinus]
MRRGLTVYDEDSRTPASTDDDFSLSSELDLLNPRYRSNRKSWRQRISKSGQNILPNLLEPAERNSEPCRCFANCDHVETKLLSEKVGKDATGHRASSLQHFPCYTYQKKYEVTFVAEKSSSGEDLGSKSSPKLCARGKSTPRIIRAIRRNSRKFKPEEDRSESPERPRPGNSKSSVVVLYHGKSTAAAPASPKPPLRATQSERTVARGQSHVPTENVQPLRQQRSCLVESPEDRSPIYSIERTKATLRRRRRLSKRRGPLNVHTYQDNRGPEVASTSKGHRVLSKEAQQAERRFDPSRYSAKSAKNLIRSCEGSSTRQDDDSDDPDQGRRSDKHRNLDETFGERCRPSDKPVLKLMARSSLGKDGDSRQRRNEAVCPNLAYLMQQVHSRPRERGDDRAFISVNDGDDSQRVFPFQPTPSGNLKIVPNQVVFESKKVSVVVADPRHTKVNVKAELNRPGNELVGRVESSTRPKFVDLSSGVSSSTINQVQGQKNLPIAGDAYRPTMHPFKSKFGQMETEQKQQATPSTSCEAPLLQEVPLAALGFTSEQPIDWDNIILPEKTDLYQELARRITNYKNADCIVRIDQDEFHCHLLVLQSYSAFFDEKNCKDVDLAGSDVSSKAFSIIYDWMISSQNESCHLLHRDNILEVFVAAQYLGIKELEEQCWAFIDNDELFTEDTAFLLYLEAKKIKNTAVMELMLPRIMKFFLMLVSTSDFLELSVDELCLLLKSNYICVNSEMEVLMSAVRWLMHDWDNRKQQMLEVLKCVRFGLIAPWQLVDVKRNPENPEFMELMSFPEVQKMVDDGLAFVIIKYWYGNQTEDYYHWIDLLGLTEPTNRNWAGEDKNYVTYREFLLYLDEYQKTKISELKSHKTVAKPVPPNSPPNDYLFPRPRTPNNYAQSSGDNGAVRNDATMQSKGPPNYLPPEMPRGLMMPPKLMNEYLSNLERSKGRAPNTVTVDSRFTGGGEPTRATSKPSTVEKHGQEHCQRGANLLDVGKLDYENRQEKNAPDVCRCQQRESNVIFSARKQQTRCRLPRDPEARADSGKSEKEAATTIQAVYRGYKARRRFHEIQKSTLDKKRNIKKVAELLAIPMGEDLVRMSNSSANQIRIEKEETWPLSSRTRNREQSVQSQNQCCVDDQSSRVNICRCSLICITTTPRGLPNPAHPRNALKPIRTIKSPMFFANYDERTSSHSDNTDTEEPLSPQTDAKSTTTDFEDVVATDRSVTKRVESNYCEGDNGQRAKPTKNVQIRTPTCNRPLPQRISSSILGSNADGYFYDDSLFFPDRESILVFGGVDPHEEYGRAGNTGKDIYRFKPDENVWEFAGEIPQARHHHSVTYLRGRVYVVGGADPLEDKLHRKSIAVESVWSYDPTTRTWFNEPGMLTARKDFGLVVSHGKMFAIGGQGRNGIALRTVEAFDPSDSTWREMQPMQTARVGPASVKYRDLIWVAGGMTKSKKELFSKDVECYDPIKNLWLKAAPLRSPRCFASFYVVSGCLYVIGGASTSETGTQSIDSIDTWDGNDCSWKELANMSIARHGHSIGSIGEQLLIIGGVTTVFMKTLNSVECYCCDIGKWMKGVSALPHPVSGHGTVSLPPANLLIDHR